MTTNNNSNQNQIKESKPKLDNEELELKNKLDELVNALFDTDFDIQVNAFNLLKTEIKSATESMTSIPKPLKYVRNHYDRLKEEYNKEESTKRKALLGNLLSILVLVAKSDDTSLKYILENNITDYSCWGQELIRTLSGEISTEYLKRLDEDRSTDDLKQLTLNTAHHLIENHNENEAIDLLVEVDMIDEVKAYLKEENYKKICNYLLSLSNYAAESNELRKILEIVYEIYVKYSQFNDAIRISIKLNEEMYIKSTFLSCSSYATQLQMAFQLGRSQKYLEAESLNEELKEIIYNRKASDFYKQLTRSIDIVQPKTPEDIFKSHLEDKKSDSVIESSKLNMSISLVNGLINAGFGTEVLLSNRDDDWLSKNKEEGIICSLASLGLVSLWDVDSGPNELEKYMDNNESNPYKRGGYNLGLGILTSGVKDENNIAFALLSDQIKDKNQIVKQTSLLGLALAYAGTHNESLKSILSESLEDFSYGFDISAFTSLAYGLIFLGNGDEEIIGSLFYVLCERNEAGKKILLDSPFLLLYVLGIGLVLLGKQKEADLIIETFQIEEFPNDLRVYIKTLLTVCAYAWSGNVVKIQELQQLVSKKEVHVKVKQIAIIGMAVIAMGEGIGMEMLPRLYNHFLQFGDNNIKQAVLLGLSLLSPSDSKITTSDTLLKHVFDSERQIVINSIFGLGLIAAGTNNSRLCTNLRKLAASYADDQNILSIIRISQGLISLGKGALSLCPTYSNGFLTSKLGLSGLLISVLSFTEGESLILSKHQYLLYSLCLSMRPNMVMTLNENLELKPVSVILGQAVDTVGMHGNPKSISGYQVNTTPLILKVGERCELNGDEYVSESSIIEDVVIVKENKKK